MDSIPPPPTSGSNAKYAIIGVVLLLGGGIGIYQLTKAPPPPPPRPAVHDAGPPAPIAPQIAAPIDLLPDEPDSGPPPDAGPPRIVYVNRYVPGCSGTIDANAVAATARSNFGSLRSCYERELRSSPELRGALSATLKINTQGRAEDVGISTGMSSRGLVTCVKQALMRVSFPHATGGCAIARVSFNFAPNQ